MSVLLLLLCGGTVASQAPCASVSECYGLGDCVGGRCVCDAWASAAPDCSAFAVEPVDYSPAPGYRNASTPSWGGSFLPDPHGGPGHGFVAAMDPAHQWQDNQTDFNAATIVHVRSHSPLAPLDGPFELAAHAVLNGTFQSQMRQLPASHGGGYILFSSVNGFFGKGKGMHRNGLYAAHLSDLNRFGEPMDPDECAGGTYPCLQPVFIPPVVDPDHPWVCHTNDWGAEILPDGSVLALFRNGGRHCENNSYPHWPAEQLGLMRASCWDCTDYRVITPSPLFEGLPSGKSNEDVYLWWSHRGIHMVLHSQDPSDPENAPHSVRGAVAFSPDTRTFSPDSWVISPKPAYGKAILLKNGTALTALRRQRPQVSFKHASVDARPDGEWPKRTVTHLGNQVDLVYGQNEDGWGAAWAMLLPLKQPPAFEEAEHKSAALFETFNNYTAICGPCACGGPYEPSIWAVKNQSSADSSFLGLYNSSDSCAASCGRLPTCAAFTYFTLDGSSGWQGGCYGIVNTSYNGWWSPYSMGGGCNGAVSGVRRTACVTDRNCSLNGVCDGSTGQCSCDKGWRGYDCSRLDLQPTPRSAGYNAPSADATTEQAANSSWGGSIVSAAGGGYLMFAAQLAQQCGIAAWEPTSLVARAISKDLLGPYLFDEIIIPNFAHEPVAGEFSMEES